MEAFLATVEATRRLNDAVSGSRPPTDVLEDATRLIAQARELLAAHPADEIGQLAGQADVPGRAQPLIPPMHYDVRDDDRAGGLVSFTRFHLGGGGAVHGGIVPLVFDEVLGRLAGSGGRPRSRTAFLHVDYRAVIPLDVPVRFDGRLDRVEGRKMFLTGELTLDAAVLCEAQALFVVLRPGQP